SKRNVETTHPIRERPPVLDLDRVTSRPPVAGQPVLWKDFYRNNRGTAWTVSHAVILGCVLFLALRFMLDSSMAAKDRYAHLGMAGVALDEQANGPLCHGSKLFGFDDPLKYIHHADVPFLGSWAQAREVLALK